MPTCQAGSGAPSLSIPPPPWGQVSPHQSKGSSRAGHPCDPLDPLEVSSLQLRPSMEQRLRERMQELRSLTVQTPGKQDLLGLPTPPPPPWELSPTASLQEPEGVQVALSAVVGYHLPTHRAEGDGQGLALALELWSQARQSSPAGSHPRPARATQEPPRQGSRTPVLGREGHGTADRMSCSICFPPHSPMALPSSKTPWWGGGSSSRLSNLRLVLTSGKWDKVAWPRTPGTLPASLCVRHGGCLCPLMFISRTSLR